MTVKNQKTFKLPSFYESSIFILYLCIGFIPNLDAIDKIAPQWLFMGFLNIIVGIFIIKNRKSFDEGISSHLKSGTTLI